jgi:hypothetical protein
MNQTPSPFKLNLNANNPFARAVRATTPSMAAAPVAPKLTSNAKRYNPFMLALNADSPEFREVYGINKPLEKPMFLGYRDNQPIYGGNRLFILY